MAVATVTKGWSAHHSAAAEILDQVQKTTHQSRGVHDSQASGTLHPQIRCQCTVSTHPNGANGVVDRVGVVARIRVDLVVRLRLCKRAELADDIVRPRGSGHERACRLDCGADDRNVDVCPQEVRVHERGVEGIAGGERDAATCEEV